MATLTHEEERGESGRCILCFVPPWLSAPSRVDVLCSPAVTGGTKINSLRKFTVAQCDCSGALTSFFSLPSSCEPAHVTETSWTGTDVRKMLVPALGHPTTLCMSFILQPGVMERVLVLESCELSSNPVSSPY